MAILIGLACGVLSGFGIGGGSLLMVYLTAWVSMAQTAAQGINLLYFLPTSLGALIFHIRNKKIAWRAVIPAALCGAAAAALGASLAVGLEMGLLRKLFGGFLVIVGFWSFFVSPGSHRHGSIGDRPLSCRKKPRCAGNFQKVLLIRRWAFWNTVPDIFCEVF